MTPVAAWVVVALLAVLVAAAVPVLLQLRRTLETAERTLESTGKRLDTALGELTETLGRVNRAAEEMEKGVQRVAPLFEAAHGIVESFAKVKSSLLTVAAVGASLGPMMVAGVRGLFEKKDDRDRQNDPGVEELAAGEKR